MKQIHKIPILFLILLLFFSACSRVNNDSAERLCRSFLRTFAREEPFIFEDYFKSEFSEEEKAEVTNQIIQWMYEYGRPESYRLISWQEDTFLRLGNQTRLNFRYRVKTVYGKTVYYLFIMEIQNQEVNMVSVTVSPI